MKASAYLPAFFLVGFVLYFGFVILQDCLYTTCFWTSRHFLNSPIIFEMIVLATVFVFLYFLSLRLLEDVHRREEIIDQSKSDFVSFASHQLRSPLTSLQWFLELLTKDETTLSSSQKVYLNEMKQSQKRMQFLIDDLLNASRIEMGSFIIESKRFSLDDTVSTILDEMRPIWMKKGVHVNRDLANISFIGDDTVVQVIVQNLLSNAIKYTPTGKSVSVRLAREGEYPTLRIQDAGIGIPKDQQRYVFSRFFRGRNAIKAVEDGTGLGLYIVRQIVEDIGGKLTFTSHEGVGSEFIVSFPERRMQTHTGHAKLKKKHNL